jgi:hypothetical protein
MANPESLTNAAFPRASERVHYPRPVDIIAVTGRSHLLPQHVAETIEQVGDLEVVRGRGART